MTDTLAELDQLTRGNQLKRPTPIRDRWGRYKRDPGGQWDWFYALDPSERSYLSRRHMGGTVGPDDLATWQGTDIDTAMNKWVAAARRARSRETLSDDYDASPDDDTLLGPDEVCTLLCIMRNTLVQWRRRNTGFPAPWLVLSNLPIWRRCDVLEWAQITNREVLHD